MSEIDEVATELRRIVNRLNSAPLVKVEPLTARCRSVAELMVERSRALGAGIPADASVPHVGPSAAGAQLAVVGHDYLSTAQTAGDPDAALVLAQLTALRRELP